MIAGRATLEGTGRFAARSKAAEGHFREAAGVWLSSVGMGTYLGAETDEIDRGYEACAAIALGLGVNVFDSAINYRGQKSERAVGRALQSAFASGPLRRDEVFVATKGGYLPHDADDPRDPKRYIVETFLESGLAPRLEIARGGHCLAPGYLRDQISRSRRNLGLETIDLYYLHNVETQKSAVGAPLFRVRLKGAIEVLEAAARSGEIGGWGVATWDGLRSPPEHPEHLSLALLREITAEVSGPDGHFRGVQLPVNLAMPQAVGYPSQETPGGRLPALAAARSFGLAAFGSASLLQGRLAAELPEEIEEAFPEVRTGARRALQFSRSSAGMTSSLVGTSTPSHAEENFGLSAISPASPERVIALFS